MICTSNSRRKLSCILTSIITFSISNHFQGTIKQHVCSFPTFLTLICHFISHFIYFSSSTEDGYPSRNFHVLQCSFRPIVASLLCRAHAEHRLQEANEESWLLKEPSITLHFSHINLYKMRNDIYKTCMCPLNDSALIRYLI